MNIIGIDYTLKTSSIDIYVSGCNGPHCEGCHNPQSWNFDEGVPFSDNIIESIRNYINIYSSLIKNVMIFGGEPLDQGHEELQTLFEELQIFNLPIWVFTRYNFEDIPEFVKSFSEYIKTGRYERELTCNDNIQYGIVLSTSNQKIYKKGIDY